MEKRAKVMPNGIRSKNLKNKDLFAVERPDNKGFILFKRIKGEERNEK